MPDLYFAEGDPRRDDVNRLGDLYECLKHYVWSRKGTAAYDHQFATVVASALEAEHSAWNRGTYPPAGHDFARQD
ncbi:hypothetical protein GXW83_33100 [Streptacidiphilus sp. PB12-B1b]|uniref:hypothetical protein n=1 Tax=Streptacidiphilus sp. PB12-B1b TaxID=2705012 RepID=UPI0015F8D8B1|nr:hypothetical protein [Streptacidiphilus sp. PB12-B1b]QMU79821.1 hypothetical protein GXW83_33100 [Streptacidiphilus sp. PB12-B1b]